MPEVKREEVFIVLDGGGTINVHMKTYPTQQEAEAEAKRLAEKGDDRGGSESPIFVVPVIRFSTKLARQARNERT